MCGLKAARGTEAFMSTYAQNQGSCTTGAITLLMTRRESAPRAAAKPPFTHALQAQPRHWLRRALPLPGEGFESPLALRPVGTARAASCYTLSFFKQKYVCQDAGGKAAVSPCATAWHSPRNHSPAIPSRVAGS